MVNVSDEGYQFCSEPINGPEALFLLARHDGEKLTTRGLTRDELRNDDAVLDACYQQFGGTSAPRVLGAFLYCAPVGRWLKMMDVLLVRTDEVERKVDDGL